MGGNLFWDGCPTCNTALFIAYLGNSYETNIVHFGDPEELHKLIHDRKIQLNIAYRNLLSQGRVR